MVFFNGEDSLVFTRNNHKGKYVTDQSGTNRLKLFIASRMATPGSQEEKAI